MKTFYRLLLLSFFSLSLLAACSKSPSPDAVAIGMMQHLAAGDFEAAKANTVDNARMQLELLTLLAKGKSAVPEGTTYHVVSKKIEAKKATVILGSNQTADKDAMTVYLKKSDKGQWLIENMQ